MHAEFAPIIGTFETLTNVEQPLHLLPKCTVMPMPFELMACFWCHV